MARTLPIHPKRSQIIAVNFSKANQTFQIPTDVDVRVMLTFLELYQTLLGFVFFKLYTDAGLVYPPPLDAKKDEAGAGVGAFSLQDAKRTVDAPATKKVKEVEVDGKRVSGKDVRQTIKSISASAPSNGDADDEPSADAMLEEEEEEFVPHQSTTNPAEGATLPTLKTLSSLPQSNASRLFAPYTFWLSRETSRPIFEFLVRSFGGRIGWPTTSGSGSPFEEDDDSITHVIIDRPLVQRPDETDEDRERRRRRKYVQPQWVVDCINAGKILLEEPYAQGNPLPPHLSPFEARLDAYDPTVGAVAQDVDMEEEGESAEEQDDEDEEMETPEASVLKAAATAEDAAALRAAELAAEAAGIDFGTFEKESRKARKKVRVVEEQPEAEGEEDMNKMMMSNKQRKLYERMKYGERKRDAEVSYGPILISDVALTITAASNPRGKEENARQGAQKEDQELIRSYMLSFGRYSVVLYLHFLSTYTFIPSYMAASWSYNKK